MHGGVSQFVTVVANLGVDFAVVVVVAVVKFVVIAVGVMV